MAALDDGIANLQRFIANLITATGTLEQVSQHLHEAAQDFAHIDQEADDKGGALNQHLEDFHSKVGAEGDEARQAVDGLRQAAAHGQEELGEAEARTEQAGTEFEQKIHAVGTHLDEQHTHLIDQGFTVLGHTLDELDHQVESARQEVDHLFTELDGAVKGFESEAHTAWEAGEGVLEEAAGQVSTEESTLATAASDGTEGFESAATELEGACSTLEADLATIYEGFTSGVDAAATELLGGTRNRLQQAAGFVETAGHEGLEAAAEALDTDALGPLGEEYGTLGSALDTTAATASSVEGLGDELGKARSVVDEIDKLLNALTE